jgi:hypothetical protein
LLTKAPSAHGTGSRFRSLWLPALICFLILVGEVYILLYDLSAGAVSKHGKAAAIATFETGKNEVRQKNGGTILWQPPSPGEILYEQDAIATMPHSEASVRFADNSELIIEPDSLIVFEEASFPKDGAPARIVVKLVRGSVKRKNSGPTNLLLKLSDEAQPIELADSQGGAAFRVVYRSGGIEVIVESGGVRMNGKEIKRSQPAKLPSPNLKKPEVEIRKIKKETSLWNFVAELFVPSTWAAELGRLISIHFSWEPVPGADAYRIQIATDPEFQSVILDKIVKEIRFDYLSDLPPQPQTLYMHVAGQDASGAVGDYSPLEKIHIQSVSEISREVGAAEPSPTPSPILTPAPMPSPTLAPRSRKKKTPVANQESVSAPTSTPISPRISPAISPPISAPIYPAIPLENSPDATVVSSAVLVRRLDNLDVAYGVLYQSRTFKGSSLPSSVTASGFVPAELQAEFSHLKSNGEGGYKFGASSVFEVTQPGASGAALQNGKLGVPLIRSWFLFEKSFDGPQAGWTAGFGPYLTNSSKFTWSGTALTAQTQLLGGALLDAVKETKSMQWRAELGIVGLGGVGADASVSSRKWLLGNHSFFGELSAQLRLMSIETSYGGTLAFGCSF